MELAHNCLTPNPYSQPLLHHQSLLSTYYAAGSGLDMKAIKMGLTSLHPCAKSPQSSENTVFTCNLHNQLRSCGRSTGYGDGGHSAVCQTPGQGSLAPCPASTSEPSERCHGGCFTQWSQVGFYPSLLQALPQGDLAHPAPGCGFPESTADASPLMMRGSDKPLND